MIRKIKPRYDDDTVLSILRRNKIYIFADCGGRGTCGRCRVRITDPASCDVPSDAERALLSENEIAGGIRLACMARVTGPAEVEILPDSLIPEESGHGDIAARKIEPLLQSEVIAVDYGTTMISGAVVDLNKGVISEASVINHQKAYGADVISRIRAANDGCGEELRLISQDDLEDLAVRLGRDPEGARYIISGNTVMGHLISGFSLKGLGEYPYTPVDISLRRDGNLTFLPGISAFVGADTVSGICACSLDKAGAPWLYVDIGTNGEMVLGAGSDVLAASAPAGPAFEGSGISCGMPDIYGAVTGVVMTGRKAVVSCEGGASPKGVCGSGVIDLMAELVRNRIIDENGTLADEFAEDGFPVQGDIVLTQRDIREIQKAKAAIRAGIETLIDESGIERNSIKKLVIAGSFGSGIDMEKAAYIGLIPEDILKAAGTAGNASLTGATLYALDTGFGNRLKSFCDRAEVLELSCIPEFPARYISYMGV
ncbi:MAG: DUF4445 domain-containing protein [Eubacterium sp.]|nr:DUF4445 domain-containing protein [Eubacterium sp.]